MEYMQLNYLLVELGICLAVLLVLILRLFPFFKRKRPALPVLYYGADVLADGTEIMPIKTFQKQLDFLLSRGFTPVLPQDLLSFGDTLPRRVRKPVLLVFAGGYQSFYTRLWPFLHTKKIKCCVGVASGLVGQYNAWEPSPWQNLLTEEQLRTLLKSGLVEIVSHGLAALPPQTDDLPAFTAQAAESAFRLQTRFRNKVQTFVFMEAEGSTKAAETLRQNGFALCVAPLKGNNHFPLKTPQPLRVFPMNKKIFLPSLAFKMMRP